MWCEGEGHARVCLDGPDSNAGARCNSPGLRLRRRSGARTPHSWSLKPDSSRMSSYYPGTYETVDRWTHEKCMIFDLIQFQVDCDHQCHKFMSSDRVKKEVIYSSFTIKNSGVNGITILVMNRTAWNKVRHLNLLLSCLATQLNGCFIVNNLFALIVYTHTRTYLLYLAHELMT